MIILQILFGIVVGVACFLLSVIPIFLIIAGVVSLLFIPWSLLTGDFSWFDCISTLLYFAGAWVCILLKSRIAGRSDNTPNTTSSHTHSDYIAGGDSGWMAEQRQEEQRTLEANRQQEQRAWDNQQQK
jgi:hypothetical protein